MKFSRRGVVSQSAVYRRKVGSAVNTSISLSPRHRRTVGGDQREVSVSPFFPVLQPDLEVRWHCRADPEPAVAANHSSSSIAQRIGIANSTTSASRIGAESYCGFLFRRRSHITPSWSRSFAEIDFVTQPQRKKATTFRSILTTHTAQTATDSSGLNPGDRFFQDTLKRFIVFWILEQRQPSNSTIQNVKANTGRADSRSTWH